MDRKRSLPIGKALLATAVAAIAALLLCGPAQAAEEFGIAPETFTTHLSTTQAGGHPDIRTTFQINLTSNQTPVGSAPKDFQITLPKGIVGAPTSVPTCPIAKAILFYEPCPRESMIGRTTVIVALAGFAFQFKEPVYSVNPYPGEPAAFAFNALFPVRIDTFVRADGDYGITVSGKNLTQAATLYASDLTLWGVPADHSGPGPETVGEGLSIGGPNPNAQRIPFLSNPTECSGKPLVSRIDIQPWYDPTFNAFAEYTIGEITGCNQVGFSPTFEARPTTNLAGAPSGLDFALHMPQHNTITGSNEVQVVTVRASEGQFQVGAGGEFSPDLPFYATAGEVQAALENLKGIGAGNVSVAGGPGDGIGSNPYVLSYQGELGYSDVDQIEARSGTQPLRIAIANGTRPGLAETSTGVPGNPAGSTTEESATAHLRDAVITLPEGMTLNPPASDGLGSCSLAEVGMTASGRPLGTPVTCPDQSKLGVVKVVTPVIENPLPGTLYLATQGENPFGSRFAIYLVVADPVSGLLVKIPGQIEPDPSTGRVTFSFRNNPQLPIEDLSIELFAGPRAPLKTPDDCGRHVSEGLLTPWTAPAGADAELESSFRLTAGPDGGACRPEGARAPNAPTFSAGTISPTVKVFTPFFLKLTRADGTQQLKAVDTILPQGLLAKLAGVSICSDAAIAAAPARTGKAEQASPSCPANSLVGSVDIGVGAGSTPLHVPGKAYLTGPYKGAPASLAIVTPAVTGPFDLGNVVVRTALYIDSTTAQVHAVTDPIPTIVGGVPLNIRSISLELDRPDFTLNPTSCNPTSVLGGITSVFDQTVSFASSFQVGDCPVLPFKPSLKLALKGSVKRRSHPSLTATLTARPTDANIASAQVKLPKTAFLDQDHIGEVCSRVQFAARACPPGSVYGFTSATTPLVDYTLSGPVYLRSNPAHRLPDLVAVLQGPATQPIEVELAGKTDSVKSALRTSFEFVPDVPVTKFSLTLFGGKKGLIEMSNGFCARPNAEATFTAQNGNGFVSTPTVSGKCGKKAKRGKKRK